VGASSKYEDAFKRSLVSSAAIARLEAELHDLPLKFSPQLAAAAPDTIDTQKMLYNTRKRQIESQLSVLHAQAAQRTQEVAELRSRLQQLQQSVVLTRKEHDIAEPLVKEGLMARTDLIRVQQELNRLNGEIRTLRLAIPRAEKAVTEMQQRIEEVTNTFYAGVARELSDERAMFQSLQKVLAEGKDRVSRTEVTSPVRGVVQSLKKNTLGGVVKPGEDIVEVVPLDSTLVVEAMIKPQDIAFLRPEQTATVKISAYDFASYGGLKGVVENISADTVEDERGNRFFRVRVRTQQASLKHGGAELPIIPGMTASVEILTGQKTVLDYLLKPLRLAQDKALRER
jgi:adhesin transport system membrane fusion protein